MVSPVKGEGRKADSIAIGWVIPLEGGPLAARGGLGLALLAEDRAEAAVDLVLGRLELDGDDP